MNLNLGFLASHDGSNVKAIMESIEQGRLRASPKVIISNNPNSGVLELAKNKNIPHYCLNEKNFPQKYKSLDLAIIKTLQEHQVNLVVLAGYMKKVGSQLLEAYHNRILNIHPSLLPKHGGKGLYGLKVHQAVLDYGDTEAGVTIHLANQEYDQGRILAQAKIKVLPNDTADSLASRVLKLEHALYSQTLIEIQTNRLDLDNYVNIM
ncbi:MAG TPA: phosphoribosylglycinamide formyltransferase [Candidatus Nanoarchaeia archaeon]|nr:phosphoribosylglycinamide formyltransferase [Candidatus Nanoarchaeia archaeon]